MSELKTTITSLEDVVSFYFSAVRLGKIDIVLSMDRLRSMMLLVYSLVVEGGEQVFPSCKQIHIAQQMHFETKKYLLERTQNNVAGIEYVRILFGLSDTPAEEIKADRNACDAHLIDHMLMVTSGGEGGMVHFNVSRDLHKYL
jgi:hypothetical protein